MNPPQFAEYAHLQDRVAALKAQQADAQMRAPETTTVAQQGAVYNTANQLLQFFAYTHLPPHLAAVSKPFADLAHQLDRGIPDNPEKTFALRKLLEAKDCAARALLFKGPTPE